MLFPAQALLTVPGFLLHETVGVVRVIGQV